MPRLPASVLALLLLALAGGSGARAQDLSPSELLAHECSKGAVGPTATRAAIYRPDLDDDARLGPYLVERVDLTYQCGSDTAGGAHVPQGWRIDVFGACDGGACERGTAVLVPVADGKVHVGTFADGLGQHALKFAVSPRGNLTLAVATRAPDGQKLRPAKYLLVVPAAAEAAAATCAVPAEPARAPGLQRAIHATSIDSTIN